jgi:hydrogenase maturation factor
MNGGMRGAGLAARYAFPPNSRGYCGPASFRKALMASFSGSAGPYALESGLEKFPVHYAYLSLIARENRKKPLDMEVVRAFWTGNRLLDNVRHSSVRRFLPRLFRESPARGRKLAMSLPAGILPHHSFNSLFVNFVTGKVARSVKNYDACCVTPGRVVSVSARSAAVVRHSVVKRAGRLALVRKTERIALEKNGVRFVRRLKKGDTVSVHWGMAIERLSPKQCAALKKYTQKNIDAVNSMRQIVSRGRPRR